MEQPVSAATPVILSHFPPFQIDSRDNHINSINRYLKGFLAKKTRTQTTVELPSLSEMAGFFQSSHMEVYDAFRMLRGEGFDYNLTGLDTPLFIWKQERNPQVKTQKENP